MGAIEDIIDGEDFERGCLEMQKAGRWLQQECGVPLSIITNWFDLLDSDPQLCIQQIIQHMQQQETDRKQCNPC